MKKFIMFMLAASAVAGSALAQTSPPFAPLTTDIMAPKPHSAYVQDARGVIVRNPFGLCWRTGYWTPADAVPGCDLPICVAPAKLENGKCVTPPPPPVVVPPPAVVTPPPVVVAPVVPSSEKVSFAADALFDFDKAILKPEGKAKLDDLTSKLQGINLEVIIAVGHTDSVGTDVYNQKLSIRRAEAVKAYRRPKVSKRTVSTPKARAKPSQSSRTRPQLAAPRTAAWKSK